MIIINKITIHLPKKKINLKKKKEIQLYQEIFDIVNIYIYMIFIFTRKKKTKKTKKKGEVTECFYYE
jgi:hypothetical protein